MLKLEKRVWTDSVILNMDESLLLHQSHPRHLTQSSGGGALYHTILF